MGIDIHGPVCGCGKRGCIEMIASGPAIARRAREALEGGGKSALRDLVNNDVSLITGHTVGEAADAGDGVARKDHAGYAGCTGVLVGQYYRSD